MATITTLGSGSSGNSYILECSKETLIIELGVRWQDVLLGLDFDISKVVGCIVSHSHSDHALSITNAIKAHIDVYSTSDVQSKHCKVKALKNGSTTRIGGFTVMALQVKHSVPCFAFIVKHEEFGKILFATDCSEFAYRVKDCDYIMCECNWDEDVVIDNILDDTARSMHEQHLEIRQTINAIMENFSDNLKAVMLLHLSKSNIMPNKALQIVKNELCFDNVYVAKKGLKLELIK